MATQPLGDIVGARFWDASIGSNASIASNGANAILGYFGPVGLSVRPRAAWWTPTAASQAATKSGSYRQLQLVNLGTSGTATTIIASANVSATAGTWIPVSFTVDTTQTVAPGILLEIQQITVGGTDANGTVLVAGQFAVSWEVV